MLSFIGIAVLLSIFSVCLAVCLSLSLPVSISLSLPLSLSDSSESFRSGETLAQQRG